MNRKLLQERTARVAQAVQRAVLATLTPSEHARKGASSGAQVGMTLTSHALALAVVTRVPYGRTQLSLCEHHLLPKLQDPALALRPLFLRLGLEGMPYHYVLGQDEYQFLLLETPAVPESELRDAVRWRVQNLLKFSLDETVIDVCDMPAQVSDGVRRPLGVVACSSSIISQKSALLGRCGMDLQVIDTAEFALRNLAELLPEADAAVALLFLDAERSLFQIVHRGTLYLSRSLPQGYQRFVESPPEQRATLQEALAGEVIRTLEYYESRFHEPAVAALYLSPTPELLPALVKLLREGCGLPVRLLDLNELLDAPTAIPREAQARCLLAVGAALREEASGL